MIERTIEEKIEYLATLRTSSNSKIIQDKLDKFNKLKKELDDLVKSLGSKPSYTVCPQCGNFERLRRKEVATGSQYWCDKCQYTWVENGFNEEFHDLREKHGVNIGAVSDGFHTFLEYFHHRCILSSVIWNQNKDKAWKSKLHQDGSMYPGYFIIGIETKEGSYTYHYPLVAWDLFRVKELEKAPEWDGHLSKDVTRLLNIGGSK